MHRPIIRVGATSVLATLCFSSPRAVLAQDQAQPSAPSEPALLEGLQAPRLLTKADPAYPPSLAPSDAVVKVELSLVVAADGRVEDINVVRGAGEAFDREARRSVEHWTFAPARRDGQAVAARIAVLVEFPPPTQLSPNADSVSTPAAAAPEQQATTEPQVTTEPEPTSEHRHGDEIAHDGDAHLAVTVHGERPLRTERRAASDLFIHREILGAAPHQNGADTLRTVPGLMAARGEGAAVAHAYSLRGFHAEHGQDIAFSVGGLPLNLPSHIHGQGYADLNFLIAEVVDEVSVSEGIADPAQGDFAVAGSIDIGLGVDDEHRGLSARSSYGSFHQFNQTLLWAPKEGERESFGAAQFSRTDGYGDRRASRLGSALIQHRFGKGPLRFRAIGLFHTARGESAGLVRKSDVDSGVLCFDCTYDDASARDQSTLSQRFMTGLFADYRGRDHATGTVGVWTGLDSFTSRANLTGYTLGTENARGEPLSDAFEQRNRTQSLGLTGRYRTEGFHFGSKVHGTLEVGTEGRLDGVAQSKDLLDAARRDEPWEQALDATTSLAQMGLWFDLDFQLMDRVNLRAGARAALLTYAVTDHTTPSSQETSDPTDTQDTAAAAFVGPRASLAVRTTDHLDLLASYGHGYRSPQARPLAEGEHAEYSLVRSGDMGFRFRPSDHLVLSGAGYLAYVGQDLVFEPHEGSLVSVGSSRRIGGLLHLRFHPISALQGSFSVNYVDARLTGASEDEEHDEHEASEGEEHEEEHGHHHGAPGDPVRGVAPLSMRLDLKVAQPLTRWGAHPLVGNLGVGWTYRSPKPLGEDVWAQSWLLLDASVGLAWGPLDLQLAAYNLLQQNYATEEYVSVSTWDSTGAAPPSEDHHFAAGPPLTIVGTLGLTL